MAVTVAMGAALVGPAVADDSDTSSPKRGRITRTKEYIGIVGFVSSGTAFCDAHSFPGSDSNVGMVCFEPTLGDFVKIAIRDASGRPVAGWVVFHDSHGRPVPNRGEKICGERLKIPVVPFWTRLSVYLAGPAEAAYMCQTTAGPATKGVVRATFIDK